jgi:hypothetical protein
VCRVRRARYAKMSRVQHCVFIWFVCFLAVLTSPCNANVQSEAFVIGSVILMSIVVVVATCFKLHQPVEVFRLQDIRGGGEESYGSI